MARHLLVAVAVSGVGSAVTVPRALLVDEGRTARNVARAGVLVVATISVVSTTFNTLVRPWLDDPAEDCVYDEGVASVAVITGVHATVCGSDRSF